MSLALNVRADIGGERRSYSFTTGFRIGRTDECEVCIKNEHVSRKHAEAVVENGYWLVKDLQSANGIYVNGERVQSVPVFTSVTIRLGIYGPFVEFKIVPPGPEPVPPPEKPAPPQTRQPPFVPEKPLPDKPQPERPAPKPQRPGPTKPDFPSGPSEWKTPVDRSTPKPDWSPPKPVPPPEKPAPPPVMPPQLRPDDYYFGPADDPNAGEYTRRVRRKYHETQTKQKRTYRGIIAAIGACAVIVAGYALYLQQQNRKNRAIAEEIFYNMKVLDVSIANLEKKLTEQNRQDAARLQQQKTNLDESYQRMLASLKIYDPKLSEEQKLVLRVARIFGECEVAMPKDFAAEVAKYIGYWRSTGRYVQDVRLAQEKGYTKVIAQEFLSRGLPPQFFYLAMQESDFNEFASGRETYAGIAKGMWQFIPQTADKYGLKLGPLVNLPRPDPQDDRHHWDRETKAAAAYIQDLYSSDAQASGLLVMACYNWGEKSVLPLVKTMPNNPRERNFWKLLELHRDRIPKETYDYVFSIISAAVIGENPRQFGIDVDNPLRGF